MAAGGPIYGSGFLDLKPQLSSGFGATLASSLGPVGKAAGIAFGAGLAAAIVGGGALAKIGGSFDDAVDTIRVGTGATGTALEDLKGNFRSVFRSVPTDMESASTAIADLNTRLGLTGKPLEALSTQVLNLSRITKTDLGGNIESISRTLGDWGVAGDQAGGAVDTLFRASQATGPSVDRLGSLLVQYGAPLRQLGFGFADSAALLGKFEKEGVNTELVMGSLRVALGKLAREGEPAQETFRRTVEEIKSAGSASEANAKALELFGARAGPDMAAAIREGKFELGDLLDQVASGSETINGAAADTDDWRQSWQLFKNKALLAIEPIAARVFSFLGDALDGLMAWWDDNSPQIIAAVKAIKTAITVAFDAVRPAIAFVGDLIATVAGLFRSNSTQISDVSTGLLGTLTAIWDQISGVIGSAIDAIRAIVSTGLKIITGFWDRFGSHIVDFLGRWVGRIVTIVSSALDLVRNIFELFAGIFTGDWGRVWGAIKGIVSSALRIVRTLISGALDVVKTILGAAVAAISQIWSFLWNAIKTATVAGIGNVVGWFASLGSKIGDVLASLPGRLLQLGKDILGDAVGLLAGILKLWVDVQLWFASLPGRIIDAIGDLAGDMLQLGKDMISGLIAGVKSLAGEVTDVVKDVVTAPIDWAKGFLGISSPSKLMRQVGRDTAAGFTAGLADRADGPGRLMSQMVGAVAAAGSSTATLGTAAAAATSGRADTGGQTMVLRVGDREFVGWLQHMATTAAVDTIGHVASELAAGAGAA